MSNNISKIEQGSGGIALGRLYRRVTLMGVSAFLLSAAIIIFFNQSLLSSAANVQHTIVLAAKTFFPYMLSAVIAAITAIGIITILPLVKGVKSAELVEQRLAAMASGDLSSKIYLADEDEQIKGLVGQLNSTVTVLGESIAQWKALNRCHWELLQSIRTSAESNNSDQVLKFVDKMENSWERIAAIEERLSTG